MRFKPRSESIEAAKMPIPKIYLVVRGDLPAGLQAVQAAHALRQFVEEHPETDRAWFEQSNTLALLALPNEATLGVLLVRASRHKVPVSAFREPDRGNELTAIALGPQGKQLTKHLPLALSTHGPTQHEGSA